MTGYWAPSTSLTVAPLTATVDGWSQKRDGRCQRPVAAKTLSSSAGAVRLHRPIGMTSMTSPTYNDRNSGTNAAPGRPPQLKSWRPPLHCSRYLVKVETTSKMTVFGRLVDCNLSLSLLLLLLLLLDLFQFQSIDSLNGDEENKSAASMVGTVWWSTAKETAGRVEEDHVYLDETSRFKPTASCRNATPQQDLINNLRFNI